MKQVVIRSVPLAPAEEGKKALARLQELLNKGYSIAYCCPVESQLVYTLTKGVIE